jgi:MoCo/4Fe-4S cofactor protein with predicted Tat translocation signal
MDFSAIRSRLAGAEGRLYWRSLGELADTPQFREYLHREFPEQASQWNDPKGRRQFLKLMSASLALAGVSACTKQPAEKIIPYVRQPEDMVPGKPLFFATAVPFAGYAQSVLVESHEGHPTKVEGNPEHPASLGATDIFGQAAILTLYDPDRAQSVMNRGEIRVWGEFLTAIQTALSVQKTKKGAGLHFLTEANTSPTLAEQITLIQQAYPQAKWHQWDPVARDGARAAARQAGGADAVHHFDQADVVVALDSDFLACGPGAIRYTKDFAVRRRITDDKKEMNRLYAIESTPTLTGARADHRLVLRASEIEGFAHALAGAIGAGAGATGQPLANADSQKWVASIAKDLQAHRGRSLVIAGDYQPAAVHTLARAINQALGNVGTTITYAPSVEVNATEQLASLRQLVQAMDAGQVDVLVIMGANPVFTAPVDLKFQERLAKVGLSVHHSLFFDETSAYCHWNVPEAHAFESWSDARSFDGTVTIMQPLIAPLYDGRTQHEVFSAFIEAQSGKAAHDLVKDYWTRAHAGKVGGWTITDANGQPFPTPDAFWKHALHDGFVTGSASRGPSSEPRGPQSGTVATPGATTAGTTSTEAPASSSRTSDLEPRTSAPASASGGLEIIFRPDPTVWDGRFANNGWLQELPKPFTKITWDPAAWISAGEGTQRRGSHRVAVSRQHRQVAGRHRPWTPRQRRDRVLWLRPSARRARRHASRRSGQRVQRLPASHLGRAVVRQRSRDRQSRPLRARAHPGTSPDGGTRAGACGVAEGIRGQSQVRRGNGRDAVANAVTHPGMGIQQLPLGDGHRPHDVHGLQHLHDCLRRREQHPGRRQGPGESRARDALDPRGSLFRGQPGRSELDRNAPSAGAVHAVRRRTMRARLPGRRDGAQRGRPERHGLQPLRRHAVLLEQLSLQGEAVQLPALLRLEHGKPVSIAESGRHRSLARRHGEMHLLRAADQLRAHRGEETGPQDPGRRDHPGVRAGVPGGCDCVRRHWRPEQRRQQAESAAAQLRAARGTQHASADDVPRGAPEPESGARDVRRYGFSH